MKPETRGETCSAGDVTLQPPFGKKKINKKISKIFRSLLHHFNLEVSDAPPLIAATSSLFSWLSSEQEEEEEKNKKPKKQTCICKLNTLQLPEN